MTVDKKINYKDKKLTKAQQKKAKAINSAGIKNYINEQETVTVPKKWLSSPDHVIAELAYITPREQKILLDADLYGSLNGQPNRGPGGIMSLQGAGDGGGSEDKGTNEDGSNNPGGDTNRDNYKTDQYTTGPKTRTKTVESPKLNKITGKKVPSYTIQTPFSPKSKIGFGPKGKDTFHEAQIKNMRRGLKEVNPGFFDSGLGKFIKTIGLGIIAPQLLAGTKVGALYSGYTKAKTLANLAKSFNITDKNVATSLTNTVKDKFAGFDTTTKGPKGPPDDKGNGDGDNQQNALMSEYLLLLQKMEQGILQKEEQGRFNILKSRLGKAYGGIMNANMNRGQLGNMDG